VSVGELVIDSPADGELLTTNAPLMSWTYGHDGPCWFEVRHDNAEWVINSILRFYEFSPLTEGNHTLQVRAVSGEGVLSAASVRVTVDTIYPVFMMYPDLNGKRLNTTDIAYQITRGDADGPFTYVEHWDGGTTQISGPKGLATAYGNLGQRVGEGDHRVWGYVEDAAGNRLEFDISFTIDLTAPEVSQWISDPDRSMLTVRFSEPMDQDSVVVDVDGGDAMVTWHSDGRGIVIQPAAGNESSGTWANWDHAVSVNVTGRDLAGNALEPWSYTIMPIERPVSQAPSPLLVPGMVVLAISTVVLLAGVVWLAKERKR